ncbi:TolC family protein [Telmatobacter bradus]|uniref:TolC family protein n=1 Tax=Telmatobacter bradus TaxID=474953 RepID=UPI003B434C6B
MMTNQKICIALLVVLSTAFQLAAQSPATQLPDEPKAGTRLFASTEYAEVPMTQAEVPTEGTPTLLTRQQAEKISLANNPRVRISQLIAKIQHQIVRERRADELPDVTGNLTAITANEGSRLSSGTLTASTLLEHAGMGVQVNQQITDFGHTRNLVASARFQEKARAADAEASRQDIVLVTDQVFYAVIEAQETRKVAEQTVAARQTLADQVSALTTSKLRSELDLSFAQVNLSQAKLLLLNAQNDLDAAKAALDSVLGYDRPMNFQLVDDESTLPPLPADFSALITQAMQDRPDLQSLKYSEQAAQKFSKAQHEQFLPTISAMGVVGGSPVGSSQYFTTDWYGAVGGNVSIPLFNGFRIAAQASQATLQAKAAAEQTRALREQVVRDLRTAWLNANTALQRVTVSTELLKEANTALDLAKTRYDLGLSSIVELSQAELQQTEAAIGNANARSQYDFAIAALNFQTGVQP